MTFPGDLNVFKSLGLRGVVAGAASLMWEQYSQEHYTGGARKEIAEQEDLPAASYKINGSREILTIANEKKRLPFWIGRSLFARLAWFHRVLELIVRISKQLVDVVGTCHRAAIVNNFERDTGASYYLFIAIEHRGDMSRPHPGFTIHV